MSFERERLARNPTRAARSLRRRMTSSERLLWGELRKLGANFRRQAPIGRYFADCASHGCKVVIEVDGGVHERLEDVALRDGERELWLTSQGYRVIRFSDRQVEDDVHACVAQVRAVLPRGDKTPGDVATLAWRAWIPAPPEVPSDALPPSPALPPSTRKGG